MPIQINNVPRRVVYAASGTGPYNFTFEILAAGDIAVYRDNTLLTLTTDYTVTINANGTGYVTLTATPTGATQIAIVGNRTIQRLTDFVTGGDFFANTLNDELDQQTIFAQQNAEGLARALQAPISDPSSINMILPAAATRATKYLGFDASGNPVALPGTGTASVINLATDVTGVLQPANGGTGVATFGTGVATALGQNVTGSGGIVLATSPTVATSLDLGGNLNITGAARRITGDFSNATVANRVMFETSTVNSATNIGVMPSGTSRSSSVSLYDTSSPGSAAALRLYVGSSEIGIALDNPGSRHIQISNGSYRCGTFTVNGDFFAGQNNSSWAVSNSSATGFWAQNNGQFSVYTSSTAGYFSRQGSDGTLFSIRKAGTEVGTIAVTTVSTAYNTSSDYRLKENAQPMTGAINTVMSLNPVTFTWKSTGAMGQGFIAHELQEVIPDAVSGQKDAVDDDGNPIYQGVDSSFLVATLVAAIKELSARVAELEAKA